MNAELRCERAATEAGRQIDPEHFGALIFYGKTAIPQRLGQMIVARRPGLDPSELVPIGWPAVRSMIDAFIEQGFSKFVLIAVEEPLRWEDELADAAGNDPADAGRQERLALTTVAPARSLWPTGGGELRNTKRRPKWRPRAQFPPD